MKSQCERAGVGRKSIQCWELLWRSKCPVFNRNEWKERETDKEWEKQQRRAADLLLIWNEHKEDSIACITHMHNNCRNQWTIFLVFLLLCVLVFSLFACTMYILVFCFFFLFSVVWCSIRIRARVLFEYSCVLLTRSLNSVASMWAKRWFRFCFCSISIHSIENVLRCV